MKPCLNRDYVPSHGVDDHNVTESSTRVGVSVVSACDGVRTTKRQRPLPTTSEKTVACAGRVHRSSPGWRIGQRRFGFVPALRMRIFEFARVTGTVIAVMFAFASCVSVVSRQKCRISLVLAMHGVVANLAHAPACAAFCA